MIIYINLRCNIYMQSLLIAMFKSWNFCRIELINKKRGIFGSKNQQIIFLIIIFNNFKFHFNFNNKYVFIIIGH
jgi:hypothetical protein